MFFWALSSLCIEVHSHYFLSPFVPLVSSRFNSLSNPLHPSWHRDLYYVIRNLISFSRGGQHSFRHINQNYVLIYPILTLVIKTEFYVKEDVRSEFLDVPWVSTPSDNSPRPPGKRHQG